MNLYNKIVNKQEKISLIGLGYVGMPIAVAFARKAAVIGFDVNEAKVDLYKSGIDPTKEVGDEVISGTTVEFTSDELKLREAKFHIVAVPTPVNSSSVPDTLYTKLLKYPVLIGISGLQVALGVRHFLQQTQQTKHSI